MGCSHTQISSLVAQPEGPIRLTPKAAINTILSQCRPLRLTLSMLMLMLILMLMLPSHVLVDLPSHLIPAASPSKFCMHFFSPHSNYRPKCSAHRNLRVFVVMSYLNYPLTNNSFRTQLKISVQFSCNRYE
jgi:hypothetical protein